jgi:hypothetical protein
MIRLLRCSSLTAEVSGHHRYLRLARELFAAECVNIKCPMIEGWQKERRNKPRISFSVWPMKRKPNMSMHTCETSESASCGVLIFELCGRLDAMRRCNVEAFNSTELDMVIVGRYVLCRSRGIRLFALTLTAVEPA